MTSEALQAAFGFTPEDLVANRAGRLSPTQQATMTTKRGQAQVVNIVMGVLFVIIIVVIAAFVLPPLMAPQPTNSSAVPPGIIVLVVAVVVAIIAFSFLRSRRKLTNLNGAVLAVEGPANTHARAFEDETIGAGISYRIRIGNVTFHVPSATQLAAFDEGKTYRAYYVKGTIPVLVAAESI